jgi:hypothetical protein
LSMPSTPPQFPSATVWNFKADWRDCKARKEKSTISMGQLAFHVHGFRSRCDVHFRTVRSCFMVRL